MDISRYDCSDLLFGWDEPGRASMNEAGNNLEAIQQLNGQVSTGQAYQHIPSVHREAYHQCHTLYWPLINSGTILEDIKK